MAMRALVVIMTGLMTSQCLVAQGWNYRMPVTIPNPGTTGLTDFQVKVTLTHGVNFDFAKALSDGSDILFTSSDGATLIPFWIEDWTAGTSATIWVKVPSIPATTGTSVYLYYGNASPIDPASVPSSPVETPPIGPFTRSEDNPIYPIGDPGYGEYGLGASLLAENIVWDPVSEHYWMIFANYRLGSYGVGLIWSDTPTDPTSWHWHGNVYTTSWNSFGPHIIYEDGLWYIFFAQRPNIYYITCSTINGTYSEPTLVLSPTTDDDWEDYRVDEPYVFKRNDGKWILVYMGDNTGAVEQIGYAISDNITGPYVKFGDNDGDNSTSTPCIPFGPAGSFDAGTVADAWVYEYHGVYYIGYTVSPTRNPPWQTAIATTTDWQTFTKLGVIFPAIGGSTGWETTKAFRGAVIRINDEYVFSYTGGTGTTGGANPPADTYLMGIATQPVYMNPPYVDVINNPDAVFDFYDGFDTGTDPDPDKWIFASGDPSTHSVVGGGLLTLTAISAGDALGGYARIDGTTEFTSVMKYVGETRAQHPDQGTYNLVSECGFTDNSVNLASSLRIVDDYPSVTNWQRQARSSASGAVVNMAQLSDKDWHIFRVYHQDSGTAGFQIDDNTVEVATTYVPTVTLRPFLMSYGVVSEEHNDFIVDWTRVRKWAGSDPVPVAGSEESLTTQWTGSVSSDWGTAGNWTSGIPAEWSIINIQGTANAPVLDGSLAIGSTASLILNPGGALTVNGDLNNNGLLTIGSTLTSSGSLIVTGASTGNITYNRQLKPGPDATRNWHLISAPVQNNSETNATKISAVYQWSETTGAWNTTSITSSLPGHGYNIRQTAGSDGLISFTGSPVNGDILFAASSPYADAIDPGGNDFDRAFVSGRSLENPGGKGWNLLGNPFTSAIAAEAFINANYSVTPSLSQFDPNYVALYLFDGSGPRYYYIAKSTGWPGGGELTATHVQAGQGFFVLAMNDNSEFLFSRAMQEHSTITTMLKSSGADDRWPGLQLKVKYDSEESLTTIVYNEDMTAGVDPGYDIGLFNSGQDIELYTTLALKDNSVNYVRQALPLVGCSKYIIPVGIDSDKGGEVTFSADVEPLGNYKFWLEDRTTGTFTDLNANSYTVTLPSKTYGTGRFFIIASTNTPTGIEQPQAKGTDVRIWVTNDKVIIKGEVSDEANCEIYDTGGRQVVMTRLTDAELNTVIMPSASKGVYLVRVIDGRKVTTHKVAIP
jgi:hypothetical protein